MKKFFKALALVLALTLVLGTVPASAATDTVTNPRTKKTLYVDVTGATEADRNAVTAQGFYVDAEGNKVQSQLRARTTYAALLRLKKSAAKKYEITAQIIDGDSSDDIIKCNDETQAVRAYGTGKSTVRLTLNNGAYYDVVITAKKNNSGVILFGTKKDNYINSSEQIIVAGVTYQVSLPRTKDGVKLDTDERELKVYKDSVSAENEVTKDVVKAVEGSARLWDVTFTKEGKYILVGSAYQDSKYTGVINSSELEINVTTPKIEEVTQKSMNSFEIKFNGDASLTNVSTFAPENIYYKINESIVPLSLVKSVAVDEKDKTLVTVTMGENFKDNTTYYVTFDGIEKTFTTGGSTKDSIVRFEITKTEYVINNFVEIEYKFYNSKDIDITSQLKDEVIPAFEAVTGTSDVLVAGNTLLFTEVGKVVTLKGTVGNLTDTKEIKSVAEPTSAFESIVYSVENKVYNAGNAKDMKLVKTYKIDDADKINVFFKYKNPDGTYTYKTLAEEDIVDVRVANENVLIVTGIDTANSQVEVVGLAANKTATVLFYKMDGNGNTYAIKDNITVTVEAKRELSKIVLDPVQAFLNADTNPEVNDQVVLTATLKDNYGDNWTKAAAADVPALNVVKSDKLEVATINANTDKIAEGTFSYTVKAANLTWKDGTTAAQKGQNNPIQFNVKAFNKTSNNVTVSVSDKSTATSYTYIPEFDNTTLDVTANKSNEQKVANLKLSKKVGTYSAGVVVAANLQFIGGTDFGKIREKENLVTEGTFVYTITKDNKLLDNLNDLKNFELNGLKVTNIATDTAITTATAITKATDGKYVYSFYYIDKVNEAGKVTKFTPVATKAFLTISGTAITPVVNVKNSSVAIDVAAGKFSELNAADQAEVLAAINTAFEFKYDGDAYEAKSATGTVSTNGSFFVEKVTLNITDGKYRDNYFVVEVTVNKLVNGSNK